MREHASCRACGGPLGCRFVSLACTRCRAGLCHWCAAGLATVLHAITGTTTEHQQ